MEKLFGWLTERHHAIALLCFVLGALFLLLGVTTGLELPGLRQIAPDANSRFVSLALGAVFIALALVIYFVSAQRLGQTLVTQVGRVPLPKDDPASQVLRRGDRRRKFPVYVRFPQPYAAQPEVVVALSKIDLDDAKSGAHIHRLEVLADGIDPHGFTLYFATDHESIVYDAVACWVAVGRVS
jgi:hypothetical protein